MKRTSQRGQTRKRSGLTNSERRLQSRIFDLVSTTQEMAKATIAMAKTIVEQSGRDQQEITALRSSNDVLLSAINTSCKQAAELVMGGMSPEAAEEFVKWNGKPYKI